MASIYLQAENLTKSFGDRILFGNLSFSLFQLDRTAIVAKNGSGKSTLLSILAGKQHPDSGSVVTRNGIRLGYLEQNPVLRDDYTILESVYSADNDISRAVQDYERAMATSDKDHLQQAIETMDRLEVWGRETKAKQILTRLRIENLNQPIANLSGGQRKRVALASVLIEEPDILILDEPTNHLDLDMVEWLEDYLIHGQQTLLMVTHDRYFLDRVCGCILEIDNQSLFRYKGNYSYFVEKRQDRINALASEVEKANNTLRSESEWIHRMPKARGTKSKYRIDAFYKLREKTLLQNLESPMEINISASRLGKKVMEVKNISKAFGSKVILRDFSYTFNRFEKLGIVGRNGTGKTTFLNIITGNTLPDSGLVDIGSTVAIGYYKQQDVSFSNNARVIDIARDIAEVVTIADGKTITVSQFLNMFLFPPEKQHDFVQKLSGGEKRRLYLLTVLMRSPNFLILDEPTNDLDIQTLCILEEYLKSFPGVVVVVSHDRFFMDKVVDGLLIFEGAGEVSGFPGSYTELREWTLEQQNDCPQGKPSQKSVKTGSSRVRIKQRLSFAQKKELEHLTSEIELLEREKLELEQQLSSGMLDASKLQEKSEQYGHLLERLGNIEMRWLELSELEG